MLLIKQLSDIKKKLKTNGYENDTNQLFIYRIGFKTGYRLAKQHHEEKVRRQANPNEKGKFVECKVSDVRFDFTKVKKENDGKTETSTSEVARLTTKKT